MEKLNKKQIEEWAAKCSMGVEIYTDMGNGTFHTDNAGSTDTELKDLPDEFEGKFEEMDMEDYNNSLLANCGESITDWDEDDRVMCILIPRSSAIEYKNWGGKREGAGRKTLYSEKKPVKIYLTAEAVELLNAEQKKSNLSRSDVVNKIVLEYLKSEA